jgi:serine/threonine protein phosphatase 1
LHFDHWPAAVYAIGDIHGCLAQLRGLHQKILNDAEHFYGEKLIVCLGDYVDRGPDSAGVIDFLLAPLPDGISRVCLAGNHESMLLDHVQNPKSAEGWLGLGGAETLLSYNINPRRYAAASAAERHAMLASHIPPAHLSFLQNLPIMTTLPGVVLVHAGLRHGVAVDQQNDHDLLWIRNSGIEVATDADAPFVVHGHTPTPEPTVMPSSICIDTGAFATGTLTAVRLRRGEKLHLFNSRADAQQR